MPHGTARSTDLPPARQRGGSRLTGAILIALLLTGGCESAFEPFQRNDAAAFSLFGYLDLAADTQWVRVSPVRQNVQAGPEPLDAVVTLEEVGSGRVVTLRDSVFRFGDPQLGTEGYAHNFWTTEPLTPDATYRVTATREDGRSSTAIVEMPTEFAFSVFNTGRDNSLLQVQAEHVLYVDMIHTVSDGHGQRIGAYTRRGSAIINKTSPQSFSIFVDARKLELPDLLDPQRVEIRLAVAGADWPYHPGLTDLEVRLPGSMPSNVENGFGFVGGVATWTFPHYRCNLLPPPASSTDGCTTWYDAESATLSGRAIIERCGLPLTFMDVALVEQITPDVATRRWWRTGWDSEFRFEGVEPGVALTLQVTLAAPPIELPPLQPGEHRLLDDILVSLEC